MSYSVVRSAVDNTGLYRELGVGQWADGMVCIAISSGPPGKYPFDIGIIVDPDELIAAIQKERKREE